RLGRVSHGDPRARRPGQRPPPQLEGRQELRRLRAADTGDPGQIVARRSHEPVDAATRGEQLVRYRERVAAVATASQNCGHQLIVAECCAPVAGELLPRTIVQRDVFHYTVAMWSGRWRRWCFPCIAACLFIVACGDDPPDREIQQAQTAIDAARAADALVW